MFRGPNVHVSSEKVFAERLLANGNNDNLGLITLNACFTKLKLVATTLKQQMLSKTH